MKHLTILLLMLLFPFSSFADEPEKARPLRDMEIERKVSALDIEGEIFYDVIVTLKSVSPDYFISDKYKVKVKVIDDDRKTVWKKTFKNVGLYVFSDGQVQVGKQGFNMLIIQKGSISGENIGIIREKEGIY